MSEARVCGGRLEVQHDLPNKPNIATGDVVVTNGNVT